MSYSLSAVKQTYNFFVSFGFGFVLGIVYDLFFIIRNLILKNRVVTFICDALFVFTASVSGFLLLLVITDGQVRAYVIVGELLGFFVYYFSLGVVIVRVCDVINRIIRRIFALIKKLFSFIFKIISFPFRMIFKFFARILKKMYEILRKMLKKTVKKSKYHLQVDSALLYNHRVYREGSPSQTTSHTKGRRKNREKKTDRKKE